MKLILHYIPFVLLFAAATALIYGWGLWRTMRQNQDLSNMLSSKGIAKVRKTLRKNGPMSRRELEPVVKDLTAKQPFQSKRLAVTNSREFLNSILPYMLKQKMITEEKKNGKILYRYRK
ncbi:MAG TPA: hypothetical protein H9735_08485 [Candidatus Anaerostipes excrementavium]|uniref:Uncharacterized protein n=1 Tax=Candidatus Anaerostipes excrementavium TaxID=2838463 RepID=A0A9D1WVW3_9FIRM|nr:hypothetical protein [uncultured Anaerostipes sp.]HIX68134.1 hypothetical protein [Candidatus Anaerostipes excrementavium]